MIILSARQLTEDFRKGPVAALLVLVGLCAGLAPFGSGAQMVRDPVARTVAARGASAGTALRASERQIVTGKATIEEPGAALPPLPPALLARPAPWAAVPRFAGYPAADLPAPTTFLYRARAPPAA